ncbi:AcrR family transcriptional regulator [Nakamurella sp. UYEF19]|uniref:TetR/AcrR family transcriptional regulator n=1 Tax=Nakamurella sp. UYEF19 TaxID=1756392 RepID=UPI003399F8F1
MREEPSGVKETPEAPRARYRRQVRDEVQTRAWSQIGQDGVSALSLKAIATQMGMTAPALYRYYSSRDELLTELIVSAYQDLAEVAEAAAAGDRPAFERIRDLSAALRRWAVAQPQRYLLLYGTPVPGHHAPDTAALLAQRIFAPIQAGFAELQDESADPSSSSGEHRSLILWTRLHGVLSLELAGHFVGMNVDADLLYRDEVASVLR